MCMEQKSHRVHMLSTRTAMYILTLNFTLIHGDSIPGVRNKRCLLLMWGGEEVRGDSRHPLFRRGCSSSRSHTNTDGAVIPWKTVCLGQRLAKLQLKLITSLFLLNFDTSLVDKAGNFPDPMPQPNWNDTLNCKPPKGSCFLRLCRREKL